MIVLDTHVLVWLIEADPRLGERSKQLIDAEQRGDGIAIAPITVWETAMQAGKGRIGLSWPVERWFNEVLALPGFRLASLTVAIGADAGCLPGGIHGDPGDRLIIATSRALNCPLLTADRKILDYAVAGHVRAVDARL